MSVPLDDGPAPNGDEALPKARLSHPVRWLGVVMVLAVVAGVALKVWGLPFAGDDDGGGEADVDAAIEALHQGDLKSLGQQLQAGRADPEFSHRFARQATPRDLGDLLASAAEIEFDYLGEEDVDAEQVLSSADEVVTYQHTLNDLAAVLSLATHGSGELKLPASWTEDLAAAMTRPEDLYDQESRNDERAAQDAANKQNLLLLLARGWWSTPFLQVVTAAFWDWEDDPDNRIPDFEGAIASPDAGPWPERRGDGADYAPAPDGTYLSDGMVALMAALTANPEASGWAFAGFQSGTKALRSGEDDDLTIGTFSAHVFFDHVYAGGAESSGPTVAYTALMSAIQATGGSHAESAIGPVRDLRVIQDAQAAAQSGEATPEPGGLYQQLKDWGHSALDVIGALPLLGEPVDGVNALWYGMEGDWSNAGLSLAATLPFVGHGVTLVKVAKAVADTGLKAGAKVGAEAGAKAGVKQVKKAVDREGQPIDDTSAGARQLSKATFVGDGTFDFADVGDFLAALDQPTERVVYKFGSTRYELPSGGTRPTLLSGPDRDTIERALPSSADAPSEQPRYCGVAGCDLADQFEEGEALGAFEEDDGIEVVRAKVTARVDGVESARFYDGLFRKHDGTYGAIEVVGDGSPRTVDQASFDILVSDSNPARAALDDEAIEITSVVLQPLAE